VRGVMHYMQRYRHFQGSPDILEPPISKQWTPGRAPRFRTAATRSPATLVPLDLWRDVSISPAVSCRWKTSKPLRIFTGRYVTMTAYGRRAAKGEPVLIPAAFSPWVPAGLSLCAGLFVQPKDPRTCAGGHTGIHGDKTADAMANP